MNIMKSIFQRNNRPRKPLILLGLLILIFAISCENGKKTEESQTVTESVLENPQEDGFLKQNNKIVSSSTKEKVQTQGIEYRMSEPVIFVEFADGEPAIEIDNFIQDYYYPEIPLEKEVQMYIWEESNKNQVSYELMLAIAFCESGFKENRIGVSGDLGLFQLNPNNTMNWLAEQIGLGSDFKWDNPYHSAKASIWYISYLSDYWRSKGYTDDELFTITLNSYNRGVTNTNTYVKNRGYLYSDYTEKIFKIKSSIEQEDFSFLK